MLVATAILLTAARGILMPPAAGGRRPSILSMPYGELTAMAGGPDGAKCVWSLLRAGREPHVAWEDDPAAIAAANTAGLSQARRVAVASTCSDSLAALVPIERTVAADGTTKLLLQLADGLSVETVLIPPLPETAGKRAKSARAHTTVCISSQVGCRQGCTFCATGKMGLRRNLDVSEILGQVYAAKREAAAAGLPPLANAVFMGMGEPADNAAAVRQAVACLTDRRRFGLGRSRVLVSTVAPTPQAFATLLRPPDEAAAEGAAVGMGAGAGAGEGAGEDRSIRKPRRSPRPTVSSPIPGHSPRRARRLCRRSSIAMTPQRSRVAPALAPAPPRRISPRRRRTPHSTFPRSGPA